MHHLQPHHHQEAVKSWINGNPALTQTEASSDSSTPGPLRTPWLVPLLKSQWLGINSSYKHRPWAHPLFPVTWSWVFIFGVWRFVISWVSGRGTHQDDGSAVWCLEGNENNPKDDGATELQCCSLTVNHGKLWLSDESEWQTSEIVLLGWVQNIGVGGQQCVELPQDNQGWIGEAQSLQMEIEINCLLVPLVWKTFRKTEQIQVLKWGLLRSCKFVYSKLQTLRFHLMCDVPKIHLLMSNQTLLYLAPICHSSGWSWTSSQELFVAEFGQICLCVLHCLNRWQS